MSTAVRLTDRDRRVLQELAQSQPATVTMLTQLFPSRAAAYARLEALAKAGLIAPFTVARQRAYQLLPDGATVVGLKSRVPHRMSSRTARRTWLMSLMASRGCQLDVVRMAGPGLGRHGLLWFHRNEASLPIVAHLSGVRLTTKRARRILGRLRIYRGTAVLVVLGGTARTRARLLREPLYPPTLIMSVPAGSEASTILASYS